MLKKTLFFLLTMSIASGALTALAQTTSSTANTAKLTCVADAVVKRDNAIIAAWDARSSTFKTLLGVRRDALNNAWRNVADRKQRNEAIKAAWRAAQESRKTANKSFRDARDLAWKQFRNDVKACRATRGELGPEGEGGGEDI